MLYIPTVDDSVSLDMEAEPPNTLLVSNGAVRAVSTLAFIKPKVLAAKIDVVEESDPTVEAIIACESGWDPNAKNPKSTAYGYGQFLDSTWLYVQKKWGMVLNRYDPRDQLYATRRLFEEEGVVHWLESEACWGMQT